MIIEVFVVNCFCLVVRKYIISLRLIRNIINWIGVRMF